MQQKILVQIADYELDQAKLKLGDEVMKLQTGNTPQGNSGNPQGDGGDGDPPPQLTYDELNSHLEKKMKKL